MRSESVEDKKVDRVPALTGLLWHIPTLIIIIALLYLSSIYNYFIFHGISGLLAVVLTVSIYIVGWNTRRIVNNSFILYLGIAFLFIGIIDASHTISYSTTGYLTGHDDNIASQLWIATRYMTAISLIIAPVFLQRNVKVTPVYLSYLAITVVLLLSIYYWKIFPECFSAVTGFTLFYSISEYLICAILLGALLLLFKARKALNNQIFMVLVISICVAIAAELAFVFYSGNYTMSYTTGHILRLLSYYLISFALVRMALVMPYDVLFRDLKLSEQRYRMLAENAQDLIYRIQVTPELKFTYVSPSSFQILGYSPEEYYSGSQIVFNMIHPDDRKILDTINKPSVYKNRPVEVRWIHKDGRTIWMEQINSPIYDNQGKIIAIEGIARNITGRKEVETELFKVRSRLEYLLSSTPAVIYACNPEITRATYISKNVERLFGYQPEDFTGYAAFYDERVHPDDLARVKNENEMLKDKGNIVQEYRFRKADGSYIWVRDEMVMVRDAEGNPVEVLGYWIDITGAKIAEEEIKAERDKAQKYLDIAEVIILVLDSKGAISLVNKKGCQVLGYKEKELIGKSWFDNFLPDDIKSEVRDVFNQLISGKRKPVPNFENPIITVSGEVRLIAWNNTVIFDDKGNIIGTLSSGEDITEKQKIRESMMVTDRLSSLGEMAMGVSHELNNPLTSVIGFTQLLLDNPDISGRAREDLQKVNSQANRAAEIIKNFITFARGQPTDKVMVNVNSMINDVVRLRGYELNSKGIKLELNLEPDVPVILADQGMLEHSFWNIIINAEHFMFEANRGGKLVITTRKINGWLRIGFKDDGPGIKKEVLPHIFDPFFTTRGVGRGSGLGLSVTYGVINQHGGKIYVESEEGKGAHFIIELPLVTDA